MKNFAGIHYTFMHYICVCELQHIHGYRKDLTSYLSSSWTPQNLPCSWLWVHSVTWSFHNEKHHWNTGCHFWHGPIFIFLRPREQKETISGPLTSFPGTIRISLIFWHEYLCSLFRNWKQIATPCLFQMKDKDSAPILGMQDKETSHDAKKSTKDSLV